MNCVSTNGDGRWQRRRLPCSLIVLAGCLALISGCQSQSNLPEFYQDLVPLTGTVTWNKTPLAGAVLTFFPTGDQAVRAAYAKTDEQGKYSAMTPIHGVPREKSQGIIPGSYRVVISKLKMPDGSGIPSDVTEADAMMNGAKESLPPKYSDDQRTVLTYEAVKTQEPQVRNFDL